MRPLIRAQTLFTRSVTNTRYFTVIWLLDLELVADLLPQLDKSQRLTVRTTLIRRMLNDNQLKRVQRLIRR